MRCEAVFVGHRLRRGRIAARIVPLYIDDSVGVVHHFVHGFERHKVVLPHLFVERFLGESLAHFAANVGVIVVFGGVGVRQIQAQAAHRFVVERHIDVLRIIAQIMPQIVAVRCPSERGDRVFVVDDVGACKFALQRQIFHGPVAHIETDFVRPRIAFVIAFFQAFRVKFVEKNGAVEVQMLDIARTDVEKNHRVLVFGAKPFGQQVVDAFVVGNRNEIGGLHIAFGVDDGVAERQIQPLYRCESEHIGSNKFVGGAVVLCGGAVGVLLHIVVGRIEYIAHQPAVYVVEFEPLTWFQIECNHGETRCAPRNDVRAVVGVAPLNHIFHQSEAAPPRIRLDAAAQVAVVAAVSGLFVLTARQLVQVRWLRNACAMAFDGKILLFQKIAVVRLVAVTGPHRHMVHNIHLNVGTKPAFHQQAFFCANNQIHAQNGRDARLEILVVVVKRRLQER